MDKQEGNIIMRIGLKDSCINHNPLGPCMVVDCFKCGNCDYKIIDSEGKIIKDFDNPEIINKEVEEEKYLIEFFDDVDFNNIGEYLRNDDSNYRLIRIKTNTVVRDAKEYLNESEEVYNNFRKKMEELCNANNQPTIEQIGEDDESKAKKLVRRFFKN